MNRPASFDIHPDIREASTLPAWAYSDPAMFEAMRERVFVPSWQFVADTDQVKVPGQVHPFGLLDGLLNEPLLLARDRDDQLHCFSNVCTHRGNLVMENAGVVSGLRCRYHGRRFTLDGRFQYMPEFETAADFPTESDDLPRVSFGAWEKFLFASLSPSRPLEDLLADVKARCGWLFPNTMLNFYPWGISVNVVRPLAVDRTKVSFLTYVWDPSRLDRGAGAALDRVEREDEAVVEAVQKGIASRLYDRGRCSPTREQGVHHFHRLLGEALVADAGLKS